MKLLKELDFIHNKKVNLTLNITAVLLIFPFLALYLDCYSDVWQGQRSFSFF